MHRVLRSILSQKRPGRPSRRLRRNVAAKFGIFYFFSDFLVIFGYSLALKVLMFYNLSDGNNRFLEECEQVNKRCEPAEDDFDKLLKRALTESKKTKDSIPNTPEWT